MNLDIVPVVELLTSSEIWVRVVCDIRYLTLPQNP